MSKFKKISLLASLGLLGAVACDNGGKQDPNQNTLSPSSLSLRIAQTSEHPWSFGQVKLVGPAPDHELIASVEHDDSLSDFVLENIPLAKIVDGTSVGAAVWNVRLLDVEEIMNNYWNESTGDENEPEPDVAQGIVEYSGHAALANPVPEAISVDVRQTNKRFGLDVDGLYEYVKYPEGEGEEWSEKDIIYPQVVLSLADDKLAAVKAKIDFKMNDIPFEILIPATTTSKLVVMSGDEVIPIRPLDFWSNEEPIAKMMVKAKGQKLAKDAGKLLEGFCEAIIFTLTPNKNDPCQVDLNKLADDSWASGTIYDECPEPIAALPLTDCVTDLTKEQLETVFGKEAVAKYDMTGYFLNGVCPPTIEDMPKWTKSGYLTFKGNHLDCYDEVEIVADGSSMAMKAGDLYTVVDFGDMVVRSVAYDAAKDRILFTDYKYGKLWAVNILTGERTAVANNLGHPIDVKVVNGKIYVASFIKWDDVSFKIVDSTGNCGERIYRQNSETAKLNRGVLMSVNENGTSEVLIGSINDAVTDSMAYILMDKDGNEVDLSSVALDVGLVHNGYSDDSSLDEEEDVNHVLSVIKDATGEHLMIRGLNKYAYSNQDFIKVSNNNLSEDEVSKTYSLNYYIDNFIVGVCDPDAGKNTQSDFASLASYYILDNNSGVVRIQEYVNGNIIRNIGENEVTVYMDINGYPPAVPAAAGTNIFYGNGSIHCYNKENDNYYSIEQNGGYGYSHKIQLVEGWGYGYGAPTAAVVIEDDPLLDSNTELILLSDEFTSFSGTVSNAILTAIEVPYGFCKMDSPADQYNGRYSNDIANVKYNESQMNEEGLVIAAYRDSAVESLANTIFRATDVIYVKKTENHPPLLCYIEQTRQYGEVGEVIPDTKYDIETSLRCAIDPVKYYYDFKEKQRTGLIQ